MKRHEMMRILIRTMAIGAMLVPLHTFAQPPAGTMPGGGYGMGPEMMGGGSGMGMGPGMMRGGGMMGMGGMAMHGLSMLDLTDDQRAKINANQDKLRKQHWEIMGKMMDEHNALRDLYDSDSLDGKKIGAVYDRIFKLKRQMIDSDIKSLNEVNALLTKEQREQLKKFRQGRGMYGSGMGMGMGSGGPMGQGGPMGPGNTMPPGMMGR